MKETNDLAIQTAKGTAPVSPNEYNSWENTNLTESMPCATSKTKPLTDDEIVSLLKKVNMFDMKSVVRAIEERHGIK